MKLSRREKGLILLLLCIAGVTLYWSYVYKPFKQDMEIIHQKIADSQTKVKSTPAQEKTIEQLKKTLASYQNGIEGMYHSMIPVFSYPELVIQLKEMTAGYAYKTQVTFMQPKEENAYTMIPIKMTMQTNYEGLKKVVKSMENSPYKNRIDRLQIDQKSSLRNPYYAEKPKSMEVTGAKAMPVLSKNASTDLSRYPLSVTMDVQFFAIEIAEKDSNSLLLPYDQSFGKRNLFEEN